MAEQFSSHADYMGKVADAADAREARIEGVMTTAFAGHFSKVELDVIDFSNIDAVQLGQLLETHPQIVKAVLYACNVASRAIARDLGIKAFDTYAPRFAPGQAAAIAGYIKPFLPPSLPVSALSYIDRIAFIDKEIRKGKGQWEKTICEAANRHGAPRKFKKDRFIVGTELFELDAAYRRTDKVIEVGIDVKRCEAVQDSQKRIDEILNKAVKFKSVYPTGKFGAVVYYPFPHDQAKFRERAKSANVDALVFANDDEDVIDGEVLALLEIMGVAAPVPPSGSP